MKIELNHTPSGVFQYLEDKDGNFLSEIIDREHLSIQNCIQNGQTVTPRHLTSFACFPEIAVRLGPAMALSRDEFVTVAQGDPLIAYYLMTCDYHSTADLLEATLMRDGQFVVELIRLASINNIKLLNRLEYYEKFLLDDPYFAQHYHRINPERELLNNYARRLESQLLETAADGYINLVVAKSKKKQLDQKFIERCQALIHQNPRYALLCSCTMASMGISIYGSKIKNLSPRYACALLHHGVCEETEYLLENLACNPMWVAHYVVTAPKAIKRQEIQTLIELMKQKVKNHPVLDAASLAIKNYIQK